MPTPPGDSLSVVELGHLGQTRAAPQPEEPDGHLRLLLAGKDLDAAPVAPHIHAVQDVEGHPALQVPRTNQVELVHRVRTNEDRTGGVRRPLGDVSPGSPALPDPGPLEDPVDRPDLRRRDAELVELPGDGHRSDLSPRIIHQPFSDLQDQPLRTGGGLGRGGVWGPGALESPILVRRIVPGHPLADPPVAPSKIRCHLDRRLPRKHLGHCLPPRLDLVPGHRPSRLAPRLRGARVPGASPWERNDVLPRTGALPGTMSCYFSATLYSC